MEQQPSPVPAPGSSAPLEPVPELAPERAVDDGARGLSRAGLLGIGAVGLLLVGALATGVLSLSGSGSPPPVPVVQSSGAPANTSGLFQLVAPGEIDQAISALLVSDTQKAEARRAIQRGALKIAWINLSDSEAEDGDWVRVTAGGFSQDVRLFKNALRVAVPYVPGAPISVTGLIDGDGHSITVAVHSGASTFGLKPLAKGETIQVPSP